METVAKLLEMLKLPRKVVGIVLLFSAFLLFAYPEWLDAFGLSLLLKEYRPFVGISFLVSLAYFIIEIVVGCLKNYSLFKKMSKDFDELIESFNSLDSKEISVIREFIIQGQNTISLPISHPVVAGLLRKRILYSVSIYAEGSIVGPLLPLAINNEVRGLVTSEKVGLSNSQPTQEEINWIKKNRPEFMGELERRRALYF